MLRVNRAQLVDFNQRKEARCVMRALLESTKPLQEAWRVRCAWQVSTLRLQAVRRWIRASRAQWDNFNQQKEAARVGRALLESIKPLLEVRLVHYVWQVSTLRLTAVLRVSRAK